jgi:hypothetical protein
MTRTEENTPNVCAWIGEGEGCRHPSIFGKSYCEKHHDRMYMVCPPEMADYILEKEIKTTVDNSLAPQYNSGNKGKT